MLSVRWLTNVETSNHHSYHIVACNSVSGWEWETRTHNMVNCIPKIFNRIKVRQTNQPLHMCNLFTLQELFNEDSYMEIDVHYHPLNWKQDQLPQHLMSQWIPGFHSDARQPKKKRPKICRLLRYQNEIHAYTKILCVMLGYVLGQIVYAYFSPDPYMLAIWLDDKHRLICEYKQMSLFDFTWIQQQYINHLQWS